MNWFTDEEGQSIQLPILELLHDVRTHWDSIYYMINRLRTLRQVCHIWSDTPFLLDSKAVDIFFQAPTNKDIADGWLQEMDWQVIEDMEIVLEVCNTYYIQLIQLLTAFRSQILLRN